MQAAAKTVEKVISVREAARQYGVYRYTLKRFIDRKVSGEKHPYGLGALGDVNINLQ